MKKLLFIVGILINCMSGFSQSFVERSGPAITAQDYRLGAKLNFYMPHTHGLTLNGGLDTLGALIYEDSSYHVWFRDTVLISPFGHKWSMILKSGDAGMGTVMQVVSGYGLLPGTITTTGTIVLDSATMSQYWVRRKDSTISFVTPYEMFSQGYIKNITGISAGGALTGTYPNPTIAINAVALTNLSQIAPFSFIGNPQGTSATPQSSYFKYGLIWQNDSIKVDTATLKTVFGQFAAAGITQLTGDGAAGPGGGSQVFTLSTVNGSAYGSITFLKFAVNGKGLVTGASPVVIGDITAALGFTPIPLTAISASSPIVYNNTTGVISCPTCGISSGGITTLNGLTNANQTFAIGYAGTSFNISSVSSTHTFNIPILNGSDTGLVTPALYTTWNAKTNLTSFSATTPLTYNNTTGVFAIQQSNTSQSGYLSGTDWTTFNGKMTNPMSSIGDMIIGGSAGAPTRVAIGANTYVWTSNGTTASWQPSAGGGGTPDTIHITAYGSGVPIISTNTGGSVVFHRTFENSTTISWALNSDSSIYATGLYTGGSGSISVSGATIGFVNDAATPGAWALYGPNGSGTKGWNAFTSYPLGNSSTPGLLSAAGYVLLNFQQTILNAPVGYAADSFATASVTQDTLYIARAAVRSGNSFLVIDSTSQSNVNINAWVINMPNQTANTLIGYNNSGVVSLITAGSGISIVSGVISSTGGGSGVTSVAMTVPTSFITVSGTPITSTGTFAVSLTNASAHTYWGNNTGSSAAASYLTNTQVTADLNIFTTSLQGLVPASGGGTVNYLRADGTWNPPSGAGGAVGGNRSIQYDSSGAFSGVFYFQWNNLKNGLVVESPSLGTSGVDSNGIIVSNPTLAASGAQQFSPFISQVANGYATTPGASQSVEFRWQAQAVQGSANPTGNYILSSIVNAGSPVTIETIPTGGGTVAFAAPITSTANIGVGATGAFFFGTGSTEPAMYSDSAFTVDFRNSTHALGFDLYNTYTSSTSYERLAIDWFTTANVVTIKTQAGTGGGTLRNGELAGGTWAIGTAPVSTSELTLIAPTTTLASMTLTPSSAVNPTSPVTGNLWYNGTNLYFYNGTSNIDILGTSGTYTATVTTVSNCTSPSSGVGHYMRVRNQVSVDIPVSVNLTTTLVATEFYVSLPISSTIALGSDLTGTGTVVSPLTAGLGITGNTTSHVADVTFTSSGTGGNNVYLHFTYTVD